MTKVLLKTCIASIFVLWLPLASSVTVSDDFTGATDTNNWAPLDYACLTAGTASNNTPANSKIPGCNYGTPDAVGSGALRLTPAQNSQHGAIVSNYTFPSNQGMAATFTTYTYGGSRDGLASDGADGISFFLMDGSVGTTVGGGPNLGSWGGSLAYSCSNVNSPFTGLTGAYLGLGMDEYGNFLNGGSANDNTASGIPVQTTNASTHGFNSFAQGSFMQANRIGLRGAGNISWYWLNLNYPAYYPSTLDAATRLLAVQNTCKTGTLWDYAGATSQAVVGNPSVSGSTMTVAVADASTFVNGDSVTIGGTISATGAVQSIVGTPTMNNKVMTLAVANVSGYSNGQTVIIGGTIVSRAGGPTVPGTYVISSVNANNNTFKVSLSSNTATITNTSGTVTPVITVPGNYTISNVNTANNTFQVTLGSAASAVTNASGSVTDNSIPTSGRQLTSRTVMDYPVIPGGYWVLPSTNLIADETTSTRSGPITYKLSISPSGLLNLNYSYHGGTYQSVLTNWPITAANGPLPSSFRFGFAGSTGGSTNVHEITCFAAEPTESNSSAGANTVQSGQVRTGTQVYLASYNPNNWNGSLVSDAIVNTNGVLSVSTASQWDANCVLTGGACASMGTSAAGVPINTVAVESPASRNILTWSGSAGVPFTWSNLTSAQQTVLNSSDSAGSARLNWLRGDRTQEQSNAGAFRTRAGVLGDIIDSSPTWVGPPAKNYAATFRDALTGATGTETSYITFKNGLATRQNVVYAGSNDGMLHGFRTGANNADGSYNSTTNDGTEVLGFVPSTVLSNSNVTTLASPGYGHSFFVDAAPGYGEVFYNGAWHTWLVGGMGPGGAEIYALDVTDPTGIVTSNIAFSEGNASRLVVGNWTATSLSSCVNAAASCGNNLGNTYGTPLIRRLHNGQWAMIFGNGLGSTNGHAGVYVGLISPSDGAVTFYWLDTGSGGTGVNANGITNVSSADLDGDFVIDYLYAGDLQGNVWRFDLTSSTPANWAVSKFGQPSATPLYVAKDSSGNRQPITSSIAVTATLTGGDQRVILGFGTGRATPFTSSSAITYQSGTHTVYGIWDWDMAAWNGLSSTRYASLVGVTTSPYRTFTRADLLAEAVATQTSTSRTVAIAKVCWNESSACASGNTQYGWKFDLPDTNEQVIYNPVFSGGELILNTTIPPVNAVGQCTLLLPTGWTMAFDMASGGGQKQNVLLTTTENVIVLPGASSVVGLKEGAVGTPYIVAIGSKQYAISSNAGGGAPPINRINTQGGVTVKRVSWEQLR